MTLQTVIAHPPPLSPSNTFYARVRRAMALSGSLIGGTLLIGTVGYHLVDNFGWLDAFHQSALLLSGMGPVKENASVAGKIFDSFYALFCGVILLGATGIMFTPVIHRILHRFHIEDASAGK
jgi:uncharacterized membrane protein